MSLSMKQLQRADRVVGLLACAGLQPLRLLRSLRATCDPPTRLLLIKFWGIGSLQLLTPAVRSLRRNHPRASLTLLTLAANREFALGLGIFDDVVTVGVGGATLPRVLVRLLELVHRLRRRGFDRVYDFEFFTRVSAVVSLLSGAPQSTGFAERGAWRGNFHTKSYPFNRYWHVARNFRLLAGGEDGREVDPADFDTFQYGSAHEVEAEEALASAGLQGCGPLVALNPNAGELALERRWPAASFGELARRLVLEDAARVVLLGAAAERAWNEEVLRQAGSLADGRLANLAGRLSLGALHALLAQASLLVTNDSGPMHLAAAAGTPTLGLFGPETPVLYAPVGKRAAVLYRPPPCSPCINVHDNKLLTCHRGRPDCLLAIDVDQVLARARRMLRANTPPSKLPREPEAAINPAARV